MAIFLREVRHTDFNSIQQLYASVYEKEVDAGFAKSFYEHSALLGYCLIDDALESSTIVGYFGCFSYSRKIENTAITFYNTHTWIVKEAYRKHSLKLLMPYLKLSDGVLTNFSANATVVKVLEKLKFQKLELKNLILRLPFSFRFYLFQFKVTSKPPQSEILLAHQAYAGIALRLKLPNTKEEIEVLLKSVDKKPEWVKQINRISNFWIKKPLITKKYFLYKIHFTDNRQLLFKSIGLLSHYLFMKFKVGGLILPETLAEGLSDSRIKSSYREDVYVKSNGIDLPQLDYLYSEVFYLNISDK